MTLNFFGIARRNAAKLFLSRLDAGFTIIELTVVLSIAIFLTASLFIHSRAVERQMILFKEQFKVISAISEAKSLSIGMYMATSTQNLAPPCGWGVHFEQNPDRMIIFEEYPNIDQTYDCSQFKNNRYIPFGSPDTANSNQISQDIEHKTIYIDNQANPRVKFSLLELSDIVFVPPNPDTIIDDSNKSSALIELQTIDGLSAKTIKATDSGQITAQ